MTDTLASSSIMVFTDRGLFRLVPEYRLPLQVPTLAAAGKIADKRSGAFVIPVDSDGKPIGLVLYYEHLEPPASMAAKFFGVGDGSGSATRQALTNHASKLLKEAGYDHEGCKVHFEGTVGSNPLRVDGPGSTFTSNMEW